MNYMTNMLHLLYARMNIHTDRHFVSIHILAEVVKLEQLKQYYQFSKVEILYQ